MPVEEVSADALLAALGERITALTEPARVEDAVADIVATLGTEPVTEFDSVVVPGQMLACRRPAHYANAAAWALFVAAMAEQDDDPKQATRTREFARLACEAAVSGKASPELMERMEDGDGIEFELAADYDDACDAAGGIELIEAVVERPARQRDSRAQVIRLWPRLVSTPRRSRPRERRSSRRTSSRGSSLGDPSRPRPDLARPRRRL